MAPGRMKSMAVVKYVSTERGLKRAAPHKDDSDGDSSDLDKDTITVKRNKRTGKPVRNGAGKRSLPAGYVPTDAALKTTDDELQSDEVMEEDEVIKVKPVKRRRVAPETPPLSPLRDFKDMDPELSSPNYHASPKSTPQELSLTFNAPPGHEGPFVVKLGLNSITGRIQSETPILLTPTSVNSEKATDDSASADYHAKTAFLFRPKKARVGFLDLAAEIRNDIYRHVLVTKSPVDFHNINSRNLAHSGSLLVTCRRVNEEARTILYGENVFKFARDSRMRGNYFDEWTQIGWKDVRRFLTAIGPVNISHLRNVEFTFENPPPRDDFNPSYVNDDYLIECLKLFAHHGALEKIEINFNGKITVKKSDDRFLHHLKSIKADEVKVLPENNVTHPFYSPYYHRSHRLDRDIRKQIAAKMQRHIKLY